MKCRLCFETADEEYPDTVWGLNPKTFRRGVMHWRCFVSAYQALEGVNAKQSTKFFDRQDEYDQLAQTYPSLAIRAIRATRATTRYHALPGLSRPKRSDELLSFRALSAPSQLSLIDGSEDD